MASNIVVVGLGYGDEGKGTIVDYLVRKHEAAAVVRFNGGAQAGHNVVLPDGRHHCFSQFGSGTFVPGVMTYLSRYFLLAPNAMLNEERALRKVGVHDALARTVVDPGALVITPYHRAANRIREALRGDGAHGSCGMGIGEVMSLREKGLAFYVSDLFSKHMTKKLLSAIREHYLDEFSSLFYRLMSPASRVWESVCVLDEDRTETRINNEFNEFSMHIEVGEALPELLKQDKPIVWEGAQGALLDENYGFNPHTTYSTTTVDNAVTLLREHGREPDRVIGVTRAYGTRHGKGPLVGERGWKLHEKHNGDSGFQGGFRTAQLDLVALRYAAQMNHGLVKELAVTNIDRLAEIPGGVRYMAVTAYDNTRVSLPMLSPDIADVKRNKKEIDLKIQSEQGRCATPSLRYGEHGFLNAISDTAMVSKRIESRGPTYLDKVEVA